GLRRGFFFSSGRRHTVSIRDWSSDVCSSDLLSAQPDRLRRIGRTIIELKLHGHSWLPGCVEVGGKPELQYPLDSVGVTVISVGEIGRASCRERLQRWGGAGRLECARAG